ncbi:Rv3235 family protein, partial [Streptomyces alkaliterrae]|uniref:Rv3235 family protein n=3 Tax=Streptomyces alkaliterrae TaxID=2213162 RepID=UPI001E4A28A1
RRDSRRPAPAALVTARHQHRGRLPQHWFAERLLLVLSGLRPVHSMLGHTSAAAYDQLARLAPLAPLRSAAGVPGPLLERVGCARPSPGAIEAFARVSAGQRSRALAFRLERGTDLRWRCCAVELDGELEAVG